MISFLCDHGLEVKHARQIRDKKLYISNGGVLAMLQYGKDNPKTFVYLKSGRSVVGYTYGEHMPGRIEVGVFVHPDFRGRGLGIQLLEKLKGCLEVFAPVEIRADNTAFEMFRKVFSSPSGRFKVTS